MLIRFAIVALFLLGARTETASANRYRRAVRARLRAVTGQFRGPREAGGQAARRVSHGNGSRYRVDSAGADVRVRGRSGEAIVVDVSLRNGQPTADRHGLTPNARSAVEAVRARRGAPFALVRRTDLNAGGEQMSHFVLVGRNQDPVDIRVIKRGDEARIEVGPGHLHNQPGRPEQRVGRIEGELARLVARMDRNVGEVSFGDGRRVYDAQPLRRGQAAQPRRNSQVVSVASTRRQVPLKGAHRSLSFDLGRPGADGTHDGRVRLQHGSGPAGSADVRVTVRQREQRDVATLRVDVDLDSVRNMGSTDQRVVREMIRRSVSGELVTASSNRGRRTVVVPMGSRPGRQQVDAFVPVARRDGTEMVRIGVNVSGAGEGQRIRVSEAQEDRAVPVRALSEAVGAVAQSIGGSHRVGALHRSGLRGMTRPAEAPSEPRVPPRTSFVLSAESLSIQQQGESFTFGTRGSDGGQGFVVSGQARITDGDVLRVAGLQTSGAEAPNLQAFIRDRVAMTMALGVEVGGRTRDVIAYQGEGTGGLQLTYSQMNGVTARDVSSGTIAAVDGVHLNARAKTTRDATYVTLNGADGVPARRYQEILGTIARDVAQVTQRRTVHIGQGAYYETFRFGSDTRR